MLTREKVLRHLKEAGCVRTPERIAYSLKLSESGVYKACREMWRLGMICRTKVWCGRGWHHRRAGYFVAYFTRALPE